MAGRLSPLSKDKQPASNPADSDPGNDEFLLVNRARTGTDEVELQEISHEVEQAAEAPAAESSPAQSAQPVEFKQPPSLQPQQQDPSARIAALESELSQVKQALQEQKTSNERLQTELKQTQKKLQVTENSLGRVKQYSHELFQITVEDSKTIATLSNLLVQSAQNWLMLEIEKTEAGHKAPQCVTIHGNKGLIPGFTEVEMKFQELGLETDPSPKEVMFHRDKQVQIGKSKEDPAQARVHFEDPEPLSAQPVPNRVMTFLQAEEGAELSRFFKSVEESRKVSVGRDPSQVVLHSDRQTARRI